MTTDLTESKGVTNPLVLLQGMIDKGADPEALKKLMDLADRWQQNQAKMAFSDAMNAAQAEMPIVVRDAKNDKGKGYAKLETVASVMRPVYTRHGFSLSYSQEPCDLAGHCTIALKVSHKSGHYEMHYIRNIAIDGTGPKGGAVMNATQGMGSTISYAKRYLALMAFNVTIADEDTDGSYGNAISPSQLDEILTLAREIKDSGKKFNAKGFLAWLELPLITNVPAEEQFAESLKPLSADKGFAKAIGELQRQKAAKK